MKLNHRTSRRSVLGAAARAAVGAAALPIVGATWVPKDAEQDLARQLQEHLPAIPRAADAAAAACDALAGHLTHLRRPRRSPDA